jgi:hypothetical protein
MLEKNEVLANGKERRDCLHKACSAKEFRLEQECFGNC